MNVGMPRLEAVRRTTGLIVGCLLIALVGVVGRAQAGQVVAAKGAVILTVAGAIGNWNRPAYDDRRDTFLKHHEITFDKAMQFDREMLAKLPQGSVEAKPPQLGKAGKFTGPRLAAVLEAAGARQGSRLRAMALDGFTADIEASQLNLKDWIVATAVDGKPLAIGDQGPLWLLHSPKSTSQVGEEEMSWPWAVFYIVVE